MYLAGWILIVGLAHLAASQSSSNDFSQFNSMFSNSATSGTADPNSLSSGTMLGSGQGFMGAGQDLTQTGATGMNTNPALQGGMNTMSGMAGQPNAMGGQTMSMGNMGGQQMMGTGVAGTNPNQMMNPNGMGLAGQNTMMNTQGMPQGGFSGGMQQTGFNGMQQPNNFAGGMQQAGFNGMQQQGMGGMQQGMGGMQQQGMAFQDPTRMGNLNNGNSFNSLAFDPRTQQGLFNDQLNQQNTPNFGGQGQMAQGQGQFGQSPFMQQSFGVPRQMGGRFATPFTSQPSGFGPFQDPMMNAFAPANPFMQRPPMMMPMGPFMMPGMRK